MVKKWIQKAHLKKGTLSRQLGIPEKEDIPFELLYHIRDSPVGTLINLPQRKSDKGLDRVFVRRIRNTKLLKRRAQLAINLKNISR